MLWSFVECINAMSTKCFQNAPSNVAPISVETMYTWQSMNEKKENSTSHDKHIFDSKTKYHKRGEDRQHTHPPYCSSITSTLFPSPKIQIICRFLCNAKKQHKPFASQTSAFQTLYHIQQTAIPCLFPESNIHQTGLFFPVHKLETKSQDRWQRNQHVKLINMHINLCTQKNMFELSWFSNSPPIYPFKCRNCNPQNKLKSRRRRKIHRIGGMSKSSTYTSISCTYVLYT